MVFILLTKTVNKMMLQVKKNSGCYYVTPQNPQRKILRYVRLAAARRYPIVA